MDPSLFVKHSTQAEIFVKLGFLGSPNISHLIFSFSHFFLSQALFEFTATPFPLIVIVHVQIEIPMAPAELLTIVLLLRLRD